jgi:membrane-bound metal-dependent hydrolase YbcI (DUF457 family)
MLFFGHIAISMLLADATDSDRTTAVAGNLTPDVLDKTGAWVLRVMPSGRFLAHGLPFFTVASLVALRTMEPRKARGYILAYAGHLICDLWAGGQVPWFAPFTENSRRKREKKRRSKLILALYLLPEVVGLPIVARLLGSPTGTPPIEVSDK